VERFKGLQVAYAPRLQPNTKDTRRVQVRRTLVNQALAITGLPRLDPDGLTGSQCLSCYAGLSTYSWADGGAATDDVTRSALVSAM